MTEWTVLCSIILTYTFLFHLGLLHSWCLEQGQGSLSLPISSVRAMYLAQEKGPSLYISPTSLCRYSYRNTHQALMRITRITHTQQEGLFPESLISSENRGMTLKNKNLKISCVFLHANFLFLPSLFISSFPLSPHSWPQSVLLFHLPSSLSFFLIAPSPLTSLPPPVLLCSPAHLSFAFFPLLSPCSLTDYYKGFKCIFHHCCSYLIKFPNKPRRKSATSLTIIHSLGPSTFLYQAVLGEEQYPLSASWCDSSSCIFIFPTSLVVPWAYSVSLGEHWECRNLS